MKQQWKPGDIAVIPFSRGLVRAMRREDGWVVCDTPHQGGLGGLTDARPLVVIDPEDRGQVARLIKAFWASSTDDCNDLDAMTKALHSLATDPKPDEPQGLGAVVEDDAGKLWIRIWESAIGGNVWTQGLGVDRKYADIASVRVLSEGWSP